MVTYEEMKSQIIRFMNESKINAYDLQRIAKDLCRCGCCKYFIQHYSQDGKPVDFGHCVKCNMPKSRKPYQQSCGSWEDKE